MNKKFWVSLFFNILETIIVYMIGLIFKVSHNEIIVIMITFFFTRLLCGKPKHFATWYRCFVWSLLVSTSLFALTDLHIFVILLLSAFTGYLSTGKADINDMYMWKGKSSKNKDVEEYIKYHPLDDKLLEFEEKLRKQDNLLFLIYKYRYKENKSFAEIAELLGDMPTCDISNKLDGIALTIRIYCGI